MFLIGLIRRLRFPSDPKTALLPVKMAETDGSHYLMVIIYFYWFECDMLLSCIADKLL